MWTINVYDLHWTIYFFIVIFFQIGYLRKDSDSSLVYTVVNQIDPDVEGLFRVRILLHNILDPQYIFV